MRLDYNILWFEDDEDFVADLRPYFEEELRNLGFRLHLQHEEDTKKLTSHDLSNIDLILSDLNMDGSDDRDDSGKRLIEAIRKKGSLVEVFFYSALPAELSKAVENLAHEMSFIQRLGVHATRSGLEQNVIKFIASSIHKLEDLNNMRGLVVANAIELEADIVEICSSLVPNPVSKSTHTERHGILARRLESKKKSAEKTCKLIGNSNCDEICFNELINQRWWFTNDKLLVFKKLLEHQKKNSTADMSALIEKIIRNHSDLEKDLIHNRNILAHVKVHLENGTQILKSINTTAGDITHDKEWCSGIRKRLLSHADLLSELKRKLELISIN